MNILLTASVSSDASRCVLSCDTWELQFGNHFDSDLVNTREDIWRVEWKSCRGAESSSSRQPDSSGMLGMIGWKGFL